MTAKRKPKKDLLKLAALGEEAGKVMHDLCGPLTGVVGYSELLLAIADKKDPLRPDLVELEKAAFRCRKIVENYLNKIRAERL